MAVTAQMVKELREITSAGMMDCQKALKEADGNMERAIEILREKGLAAAAKKAGRVAAEGIVYTSISEDGKIGVILEVNSETDFVAKNAEFQSYVKQVAEHIMNSNAKDAEELLKEKWNADNSVTVEEALSQKVAVIGENLKIRRFVKFENSGTSAYVSYIHAGGKVAVLLDLFSDVKADEVFEAGRNVAMQIAAMSPKFVHRDEVPKEYIEKEMEILKQQAINEGKPANIVEKMIQGRLNKEIKEICLNDQLYIRDEEGKNTVSDYLNSVAKQVSGKVYINKFVRFATGEGIEKKEENFAEEVNKAIKG